MKNGALGAPEAIFGVRGAIWGVENSIKIGPWTPKGRQKRSENHHVVTKSVTAWLEGPRGGPKIKDNRQIYENNDDGGRSDTPLGRWPGEFVLWF